MKKRWTSKKYTNEEIEEISKKYNTNILQSILVFNRFGTDISKLSGYTLDDLRDPYLLPDMSAAVDCLMEAIEDEEAKIVIYGDYDVDGNTSVAILVDFFRSIGLDVLWYIPNRIKEGYGLNKKALDELKQMGCTHLITVDTGIAAFDEIDYANELGFKVVLTDHHEVQEKIPNNFCVVDPKREEYKYFKDIAGCFVALKLVQALCISLGLEDEYFVKYIPFATLGTIADVMPLVDENRALVSMGLAMFKTSEIVSVAKIYDVIKDSLTAKDIAFSMIPKLNAPGRLGYETTAEFLVNTNNFESQQLYDEICKLNDQRKALVQKAVDDALVKVANEKGDVVDSPILVYSDDYHEGIVGIVAAKVADHFGVPAIVMTKAEEGYKGSGRAKDGNIFAIAQPLKDYTTAFGGHDKAIGLSVSDENIAKYKELFESTKLDEVEKVIQYDCILKLSNISYPLLQTFELLEPFGQANPEPTFLFKDVVVENITQSAKYARLEISQEGAKASALTFDPKICANIQKGDRVMIIGTLKINVWNGRKNIYIQMVDIEKMK